MTGLLGKLFGKKKEGNPTSEGLIEDVLNELIERMGLSISYELKNDEETGIMQIELFGEDEELIVQKDGALLDSIQLFLKRVVQHKLQDAEINIGLDCNGFRADTDRELIELAERLKDRALEQGRSVYVRALPPKDRRVIHQYLANDGRVKSRSIGDGLYKKIKIYPIRPGQNEEHIEDDERVREPV